MMTRLSGLLLGLLFCAPALSQHPASPPSVTWLSENFAPLYIHQGKHRGTGTADRLLRMVVHEMTAYQHKLRNFPIKRITHSLKKGENIACISFLKDPSIDAFAQYSEPVFILPPQQLITSHQHWQTELGKASSVSLEQLLKQSNEHRLGIATGRNYGKFLTPVLDQVRSRNSDKILTRTGDHFKGLANMINHGRLEYTLAYSGEMNYFNSINPKSELVAIPIKENPYPLYVYAVMPKTPWGNRLRRDLNAALKRIRHKPDFIATVTDWFHSTPTLEEAYSKLRDHRFPNSEFYESKLLGISAQSPSY